MMQTGFLEGGQVFWHSRGQIEYRTNPKRYVLHYHNGYLE